MKMANMSTMQYSEYAVEPFNFFTPSCKKYIKKSSEYFYYRPTKFFLHQNHNSIYATFSSTTIV